MRRIRRRGGRAGVPGAGTRTHARARTGAFARTGGRAYARTRIRKPGLCLRRGARSNRKQRQREKSGTCPRRGSASHLRAPMLAHGHSIARRDERATPESYFARRFDLDAFSKILEIARQSSRFRASLIAPRNFPTLALFTFVFSSAICYFGRDSPGARFPPSSCANPMRSPSGPRT